VYDVKVTANACAVLFACIWIALALAVFAPRSSEAADDDTQEWSTVTIRHSLDERWTLSLESRVRFDDDISRAKDLLIGPAIDLKLNDTVSLGLGYDYVYSFKTDATSENRIWEQIGLHFINGELDVENRLRLDERFLEGTDGAVYRLRYRLRLLHPIGASAWKAVGSDEVFLNLNSPGNQVSGFEQNRLFAGVGRTFWSDLWLEAGYQWGYQAKKGAPNQVTNSLIVNLTYNF
jgi:Protein of unknown function (DUF2490)